MFPGWMQIAIVVVLVLLLFGRGRISEFMGDFAKGITAFKKGLKEDPAEQQNDKPEQPKTLDAPAADNTVSQDAVQEKEKSNNP